MQRDLSSSINQRLASLALSLALALALAWIIALTLGLALAFVPRNDGVAKNIGEV